MDPNSSINSDLLIKGLALLGGAKGLQGILGHFSTNSAIDQQNQSLPAGYTINKQKGWFDFRDSASRQKAIEDLAKQNMAKYTADDAKSGLTGQGYAVPFNAQDNITNFRDKVYDPSQAKYYTGRADQMLGGAELQAIQNNPSILGIGANANQSQPQQPEPMQPSPNLPPMDYSENPQSLPPLQGGVSQAGQAPPPSFYLPQGNNNMISEPAILKIMNNNVAKRGQDMTAQTAANAEQGRQARFDAESDYRKAKLDKTIAEIKKIGEETKWVGPRAQAAIRKLAQVTGHSFNQIDAMLASGHSIEEVGDALLSSLQNKNAPMETTVYGLNGKVKSSTVKTRQGVSGSGQTGSLAPRAQSFLNEFLPSPRQ